MTRYNTEYFYYRMMYTILLSSISCKKTLLFLVLKPRPPKESFMIMRAHALCDMHGDILMRMRTE